ncbi:MAG: HDOD domain-containing protein [Candidatus Caldatribacteriaceae bacterium]
MGKVSLSVLTRAIEELPALPAVVQRVIQLTEDPKSTAKDINNVLTQDQSLTAKVLRLANSAFYGFPRRISTITEATIILGFQTIKSMVMATTVSEMLKKPLQGYALEQGELWKHSQTSAIAARMLARETKFSRLEVAYTASLLHDIGKLILNTYLSELYQEVLEKVEGERLTFTQAEEAVFGFNHAQAGAKICEKWNLPPELVEAIALHHEPERATINPKLVAITHIADFVSVSIGMGVGIDGFLYAISPEAVVLLGISETQIDRLLAQLTDILVDQDNF